MQARVEYNCPARPPPDLRAYGKPVMRYGESPPNRIMSASVRVSNLTPATLELLSQSIGNELEKWIQSGDSVSIFVTGKTGGGKSALVNAMVGVKVAPEGADPDPTTTKVMWYENEVHGVSLKVWDSPGLQDGTRNEKRYIADMKEKCVGVDLFLICINVGDAIRFNCESPEVRALEKLTEVFGHALWDRAVIALTFSNRLGQKDPEVRFAKRKADKEKLKGLFVSKISEWEENLRRMLGSKVGLDSVQVQRLKIVPTGFRNDKSLPDRPHWLSTFWFSVLRSMHKRAQPAMLRMNRNRIIENPDAINEKTRTKHDEDQMFIFEEYGREVGSRFGVAEIGSIIGLSTAQMASIQLRDRIVLEQYVILNVMGQNPSSTCEISGTVQKKPTAALSSLPDGTEGSTEEAPCGVEGSPGPISPMSECSGIDEKGF